MVQRTCSVEGCERPHFTHTWCSAHYGRWKRHGDLQVDVPIGRKGRKDGPFVVFSELEARFWPKVAIPANPLDCWEWTAAKDKVSGYGRMQLGGTSGYAHRVSYELSMGQIGDGLQIDHLCRNKSCVNPLHLQAVPAALNVQRAPRNQVTHCPQGHPYSGDNLRMAGGRRLCRTCQMDRARVSNAKRAAAKKSAA